MRRPQDCMRIIIVLEKLPNYLVEEISEKIKCGGSDGEVRKEQAMS